MYEDVPELARVGLYHIVEQFFEEKKGYSYSGLYKVLCIALRIPVLWQGLKYKHEMGRLSDEINTLFREEHLGFEFRDGKVEKIGSGFTDARVKEARYLLKEPEFKGADKHFEKALKALNTRPNPDVENCIKDAVSAIESVARIMINDEKARLSYVIKDEAEFVLAMSAAIIIYLVKKRKHV
jgi:tRNA(His) 5'-end guanylyltransferase